MMSNQCFDFYFIRIKPSNFFLFFFFQIERIRIMPIERGLQYLRQMQRVTLKNLPMPLEKTEKWKREHVNIFGIDILDRSSCF